jgi:hypothetical protein
MKNLCLLFLLGLSALTWSGRAETAAPPNPDRDYSVRMLIRIAEPVLAAAAEGRLKERLPHHDWERDRAPFTELEALGRTLAGVAPWLELGPDETPEGRERARLIQLAVKSLASATDPQSSGFMNFTNGSQPLVDAAFLAHGLLRAPTQLWAKLDARQQGRVAAALKATRAIQPGENNWLLFSAMVEAALWRFTGECELKPIAYAVSRHQQWYAGDGVYGDGPRFHWDYYNSYVIQPMLLEVLRVCAEKTNALADALPQARARARRYAAAQERLISPEGTFPVIGRSSAYRIGALQHLANLALARDLPKELNPGAVRGALTAVTRRMLEAPGTFDAAGWLQVGAVGHQPSIRENYIATGSLYLCLTGLVHLGLPANDPFWTAPAAPWTQRRIWAGEDIPADHAE